jgi:hypothetical protein
VTDAAFVLHPVHLAEVRRLALSRADEDKTMWQTLDGNTRDVISLAVHRMLMVEKRSTTVTASLKAEIQNELDAMNVEYGFYINGFEPFVGLPASDIDPERYWVSKGVRFVRVAMLILNVAVTISDVERLHKSYSRIHTTSRASLQQTRVDNLVLSQVAAKNELNPAPKFDANKAFSRLTPQQEEDLMAWSKDLKNKLASKKADAQRADGEPTATPLVRDVEMAAEDGAKDAADSSADESADESDPEFVDSAALDDDDEEREMDALRRSSRARVAPKRFRDSLDKLKTMESVGSS